MRRNDEISRIRRKTASSGADAAGQTLSLAAPEIPCLCFPKALSGRQGLHPCLQGMIWGPGRPACRAGLDQRPMPPRTGGTLWFAAIFLPLGMYLRASLETSGPGIGDGRCTPVALEKISTLRPTQ